MKYRIWHNTNGIVDEYWIFNKHTHRVYIKLPRWLGRLIMRILK